MNNLPQDLEVVKNVKPMFNLETAVQDDKVMQNFELESLPTGADHSQMVKAAHVGSDSSSKFCITLSSSTAVSRFKELEEQPRNRNQVFEKKKVVNFQFVLKSTNPDIKDLKKNLIKLMKRLSEGFSIASYTFNETDLQWIEKLKTRSAEEEEPLEEDFQRAFELS